MTRSELAIGLSDDEVAELHAMVRAAHEASGRLTRSGCTKNNGWDVNQITGVASGEGNFIRAQVLIGRKDALPRCVRRRRRN
jgi:hypothetical protein